MFIAIATHNRPALTRLCLEQQIEAVGDAGRFHIWDDNSAEPPDFDGLDLASLTRLEANVGPHVGRALQIKAFLESDEEILYLSDSDALLDPECLDKGERLLGEYRDQFSIVCLYNSPFHGRFEIEHGILGGQPVRVRSFAPGISMMIHRETLKPLAPEIEATFAANEWDFVLPMLTRKPCLVTDISFVEHMGAGGIHSKPGDWDRDRAVNPTYYLRQKREEILTKLGAPT